MSFQRHFHNFIFINLFGCGNISYVCYHDSDSNLNIGQGIFFDIADYCFLPDDPE